jgi:signal transduction histidine kinase/CheY-like chemotaxis protein
VFIDKLLSPIFLFAVQKFAVRLFVLSSACWWGAGLAFSNLWWLTNSHQMAWILFCYAWEVPVIGWTGVVVIPLRVSRRPRFVAMCAIVTSTLGYTVGALQLIVFAHLPYLEAAKMSVQGVLLGAILAAAVYLEAERAAPAMAAAESIRYTLAKKVRYITITIALGAAMPIFLYGLTVQQRQLEEARGAALLEALAAPGDLRQFGSHTTVYTTSAPLSSKGGIVRIGALTLDALFTGEAGWFASRYDGHRVVAYRRTGTSVRVAVSPLADYGQALIQTTATAGALGLVALLIAWFLAFTFSRNLVDPLQRLFDEMTARVRDDEAKLVQSEKLSAVGRVVSGIAHELNNPLAAILHFAENLLAEETQSASDREMLLSVATQARRARAIVRDLLSFVRARAQTQQAADIRDVVRHATEAVAPTVAETGATLSASFASTSVPIVRIDEGGIEQVLTNLIVNAAQAAGAGGTVDIAVVPDGDRVRLSVSDTGPGISNDVLPRIFEPFFTTKGQGKGTGLGLPVSLGIVQQHGGQLTVENRPQGGARFTLDVPVHPDQDAAAVELRERPAHTNGSAAVPRGQGETVMVIDDEESIRFALRYFLERSGWRVEEAGSGRAALDILLDAPANRYRAVITDLTMPDVTGIELHDRLATERPDICERLIIATGETISDTVVSFRARSGKPFLEKPFELDALTALLEQMP